MPIRHSFEARRKVHQKAQCFALRGQNDAQETDKLPEIYIIKAEKIIFLVDVIKGTVFVLRGNGHWSFMHSSSKNEK